MRRSIIACCLLLLVPAFARSAAAENSAKAPVAATVPAQPSDYYHLNFLVEQLDAAGKIVNSRSYSTTVSTGSHAAIMLKTGSRIPIATGEYSANGGASSQANTQFQYINLGIQIVVSHAQEVGRQLAFDLRAELSSVGGEAEIAQVHEPIIRQNTWQSPVLIPIGKPTVVFKSDEMDSKGSTQILVTATRLE